MNVLKYHVIELIGEPEVKVIELKDSPAVYCAIQKVKEDCYGRKSISKVSRCGDTKEESLDKISEVKEGYTYLS